MEDAAHIKGSPMDVAAEGSPVGAADKGRPVRAAAQWAPMKTVASTSAGDFPLTFPLQVYAVRLDQ